jgi:outer membrane protein
LSRLFLVPLLAVAGLSAAQAQQKVGVMNVQAAIASTKDGQKASVDLAAKYEPKKKEVESRQNEIAALKDQLQKGQNTLTETAKAELIRNIDVKTKSLQRQMEDAEAELQLDQQKAVQTIYEKMQVVIEKYAKDNAYTLILDVNPQQNLVVWASSAIDVSKLIVDLYDKNTGPIVPAAAPAPKPPVATPKAPAPTNKPKS